MKQAQKFIGILIATTIVIACNVDSQTNNNPEISSQEQIDSLRRIKCDTLLIRMQRINADTLIRVERVPTNFEESLVILDLMINAQMKEWIKCLPDGEFCVFVHHGFGMHLRNNWGLWGNSELAENLFKMGILHPDDMSAIILDSYQRKLKGEEIKLEAQVKHFQDYWQESGVSVDSILNKIEQENGG